MRLKLLNANRNAAVTGARELPGKVNYFIGNNPRQWRTNVPTYAEVRYRNVYPGIDLVYYGNQAGRLEYDFVVAPGADPSSILLAINAAEPVRSEQRAVGSGQPKIDSNGDLVVHTEGRDMAFVSASPSSLDLSPGQSGNYTWAVTASGGFNHAVDFSCSVTASNNPNGTGPPPATCTTSPAVVTPTTTPTNVTVTVTIPVSSGSVPRTLPPLQKRLPAPEVLFILSALLATAASKVQRWKQAGVSGRRKPLVLLAAGLLLAIGLAGCGGVSRGGGGSDPPVIVTTGTYYTVAVTGTATSGSTTLTNMSNIQIYVPN